MIWLGFLFAFILGVFVGIASLRARLIGDISHAVEAAVGRAVEHTQRGRVTIIDHVDCISTVGDSISVGLSELTISDVITTTSLEHANVAGSSAEDMAVAVALRNRREARRAQRTHIAAHCDSPGRSSEPGS